MKGATRTLIRSRWISQDVMAASISTLLVDHRMMMWNRVVVRQRANMAGPVYPEIQGVSSRPAGVTRIQRRFLASEAARWKGRRRFYLQVGVEPCAAPWVLEENDKKKKQLEFMDETEAPVLPRGVDGSHNAGSSFRSNTTTTTATTTKANGHLYISQPRDLLIPRTPGRAASTESSPAQQVEWYTVTLDGQALKTPMGHRLVVPGPTLAMALATEWNAAAPLLPHPTQMPMTTLVCTALDQVARSALAPPPKLPPASQQEDHVFRQAMLRFIPTDTVCYYADPLIDRPLHQRQEQAWRELHAWIPSFTGGLSPGMAVGAQEGVMYSKTVPSASQPHSARAGLAGGLAHPAGLMPACQAWVQSLDAWHLTAAHAIALESKSFWIAAAAIYPHHHHGGYHDVSRSLDQDPNFASSITSTSSDNRPRHHPDQEPWYGVTGLTTAARVEEEFQIESWGLVEGQHDYDRLNAAVQIRSAILLKQCLAADGYL